MPVVAWAAKKVGRPVKWLKEIVLPAEGPREWEFHQVALTPENVPWMTRRQVRDRVRRVSASRLQYAQRILGAWEGISDDRQLGAFDDRRILPLTVSAREGKKVASCCATKLSASNSG